MTCVLAGGRHTFGSQFSGRPRTFLLTLLTSPLPALIKFCLGNNNETIFLHSLNILPNEIMQSSHVSSEEEPAANTTNREPREKPHCPGHCASVCVRGQSLPKGTALGSQGIPLCAMCHQEGSGKGWAQSMTKCESL